MDRGDDDTGGCFGNHDAPWEQVRPSRGSGSGSHGQIGSGIGLGLEQVAESGTEFAVEDGTADLEQETGVAASPLLLP